MIEGFAQKLGNPNFVDRAPPEVLEETRAKKAAMELQKKKLEANLSALTD